LVQRLALLKANDVSKKVKKGILLGADTVVVCDGSVIGKPKSVKDARRILRRLSGSWHEVYTGVAVIRVPDYNVLWDYSLSRIKMRKLTKEEIIKWSDKNLDKAGAYAVQEQKDDFIEKIIGDYDNVVGLPMRAVKKLLRKAGSKK